MAKDTTNAIADGKVVDLAYTLKNSTGEVLDQSSAGEPFTYLHGGSQIVPGLEAGLLGLKAGDKKNITVAPEDAYGKVNESLRLSVKRAQFPESAPVQAGMQFQAQSPEGHGMVFTVSGIEGDEVKIDGNHPLAGETLHFAVEVLKMREATQEEMEHGHAHGPDGHHHH